MPLCWRNIFLPYLIHGTEDQDAQFSPKHGETRYQPTSSSIYQYKELNTSVGCFSDDRCTRSITEAQRFFCRTAHVSHSGLVASDSLIGCGYLR